MSLGWKELGHCHCDLIRLNPGYDRAELDVKCKETVIGKNGQKRPCKSLVSHLACPIYSEKLPKDWLTHWSGYCTQHWVLFCQKKKWNEYISYCANMHADKMRMSLETRNNLTMSELATTLKISMKKDVFHFSDWYYCQEKMKKHEEMAKIIRSHIKTHHEKNTIENSIILENEQHRQNSEPNSNMDSEESDSFYDAPELDSSINEYDLNDSFIDNSSYDESSSSSDPNSDEVIDISYTFGPRLKKRRLE